MTLLTRRPSEAGKKTYWLDVKYVGFARLHTTKPGTRQSDPELVALAAVVEHAPQLLAHVRALLDVVALKSPTSLTAMPECVAAAKLLERLP